MRKIDDGEKKKEKKTVEIVATNVVASLPPNGDRLQCRPLVPKSIYGYIHLKCCAFFQPGLNISDRNIYLIVRQKYPSDFQMDFFISEFY